MFKVESVEVTDWRGQEIVPIRGAQKGRRATVLVIYEKAGRLMMDIKYCDTGKRAFYCSPFNFVLAKRWEEKRPYKPRPESIEKVKKIARDERRLITIKSKEYLPVLYGTINPRLLRYLVDWGFLAKAGTVQSLLERAGLHWENYRDEKEAKKFPWFERNVSAYEILRDFSD